jgi:ribonuclease HI
MVTITTDGAARGNPGPGGWAALLEYGESERLLTREEPGATTNNAMELRAVIGGFEALKKSCCVLLRADSTYVLDGLQHLLQSGQLAQRKRDLWARLLDAVRSHEVSCAWVRGHSGAHATSV